jgi:hypothetical protein
MYKLLRCKGWTEILLFVEDVPQERLGKSDKIIGFLAWILAQGGLVMSIPGFFSLMLVAELVGRIFEAINFRRLVVTDVKERDRDSAIEVVEQCYVGDDLQYESNFSMLFNVRVISEIGNLPCLRRKYRSATNFRK